LGLTPEITRRIQALVGLQQAWTTMAWRLSCWWRREPCTEFEKILGNG